MIQGPQRVLGRYALYGEIASGGMATVHFGRLLGPVGFSRTVAIKRLHPQFAKDPDFVAMFLDEARLAARIQHPNVVATIDVVAQDDELFLVMEYVEGESFSRLLRGCALEKRRVPPRIVGAIASGALYGLHAAHEAKNERGEPLYLVHRDVSPQNILVGVDGVARVLDFGIAKAVGRTQNTREGQIKGKIAYMPPEQISGGEVDRRVDVYAAGVVVWEALVGKRLFEGENEAVIFGKILKGEVPPPSTFVADLPDGVDAIVMRALSREPSDRFPTAWDFAVALEDILGIETPRRVGAFVDGCAKEAIQRRVARVKQLESLPTELPTPMTASSVLGAHAPVVTLDGSETSTRKSAAPTRTLVAALGVMAALGALAALLVLALVSRSPERAALAPSASEPASVEPAGSPVPASPSVGSPASASASADMPPLAGSSAALIEAGSANATALSAAPTHTAASHPAWTSRPTATAPPAVDSCRVPYVIVDGIRKLKPECI